MSFSEFQSQWMSRSDFGKNPALLAALSEFLQKLTPSEKTELIADVLDQGWTGLAIADGKLLFLEAVEQGAFNEQETFSVLLPLLDAPEVEDRDVWKIFSSVWMRRLDTQNFPERALWIFAYVNFRKLYASLFIEALRKNRGFEVWRGIVVPIPGEASSETSLKDLIIKVLNDWPTSGRSGYSLLCQLRENGTVQELGADPEILAALERAENRCDFGSLEKIRAARSSEGGSHD